MIDKYKKRMYIYMSNFPTFCPVLSEDCVRATEQLMNALVKNSTDNISLVVKKLYEIKHIYLSYHQTVPTMDLIDKIVDELAKFGIDILAFNDALTHNIGYKTDRHFKEYAQKQEFLNLEFDSENKISFDGVDISFNVTFITMIEGLISHQQQASLYNTSDDLVYLNIIPQCEQLRYDSRNVISDELRLYGEKIETIIALSKKYPSTEQILEEHYKKTGDSNDE